MRLLSEFLEADLITNYSTIVLITYGLDDMNHAINFILYCVTGTVFRQTLVKMFQSRKKKRSQIEEHVATVETQV